MNLMDGMLKIFTKGENYFGKRLRREQCFHIFEMIDSFEIFPHQARQAGVRTDLNERPILSCLCHEHSLDSHFALLQLIFGCFRATTTWFGCLTVINDFWIKVGRSYLGVFLFLSGNVKDIKNASLTGLGNDYE